MTDAKKDITQWKMGIDPYAVEPEAPAPTQEVVAPTKEGDYSYYYTWRSIGYDS